MDENGRSKLDIPGIVGLGAFFAVLLATPWVVYLASLVILRLDPGATPETFAVVYRTLEDRYAVTRWPGYYPRAGISSGFRTFRLPEPAGYIDGPKLQYAFSVVQDDGARQVVEVRTSGVISAVSRYASYPDRVEPLGYRGLLWGYEQENAVPGALIALGLAILAAWSAFAAARFAGRVATS
jgi:hypothetical protein